MTDPRPAWSRDSAMLRIDRGFEDLEEVSEEWAFAGADGFGVRVAVIDSGIDADHLDLIGAVDREGAVMFGVDASGEVVRTDGPHVDVFGHGTACAGIIHSLAPGAELTSVRVLGEGLTGKAAAFLAGLNWAIDEGFDVINLSLGTGLRDWALAFYEACDRAYFSGSFIVTAANNIQRASFPSLFGTVASVACNLSKDPRRYHWNPDPPTEFLAPGIDIDVIWKDGGHSTGTGNSYAAPHISGLAAQILSKHPELRPFQLKSVLCSLAVNVRDADAGIEVPGRLSRMMTGMIPQAGSRGTVMGRPVAQ